MLDHGWWTWWACIRPSADLGRIKYVLQFSLCSYVRVLLFKGHAQARLQKMEEDDELDEAAPPLGRAPAAPAGPALAAEVGGADDAASVALLPYERQIAEELIAEDGLCVMASGLGWHRIVAVFVRLCHYHRSGVVLVLGCQPWQRDLICAEVARHDPAVPHPVDINADVRAA
jgi:hypothetical protein